MSGCSPGFSPAPAWQKLTPVGGFVSGVRWPTRGCGSTLIAERLTGKKTEEKDIFNLYREDHTYGAGCPVILEIFGKAYNF